MSVRKANGSQVDPESVRRHELISREIKSSLNALVRPRTFLPYFGVLTLCILWLLSEIFPKMTTGAKLLVAVPLGAFFGHFFREFFIARKKRTQE